MIDFGLAIQKQLTRSAELRPCKVRSLTDFFFLQKINHECYCWIGVVQVCDQIVVVGRKTAAEMQVDDVEDYDYNNAADRDDYCPDVDDDGDAYDGNTHLNRGV